MLPAKSWPREAASQLPKFSDSVHGLSKACDGNQLCNQCNQLCVISAMDDGNCSPWGSETVSVV